MYGSDLTKGSQNGRDTWLFRHFARKCGEGDIDRVAKRMGGAINCNEDALVQICAFRNNNAAPRDKVFARLIRLPSG